MSYILKINDNFNVFDSFQNLLNKKRDFEKLGYSNIQVFKINNKGNNLNSLFELDNYKSIKNEDIELVNKSKNYQYLIKIFNQFKNKEIKKRKFGFF